MGCTKDANNSFQEHLICNQTKDNGRGITGEGNTSVNDFSELPVFHINAWLA